MKKKFYFIAFILLSMSNFLIAQDCGTELLAEQVQYMNNTRTDRVNTNISLLSENEEVVNLQIAAHIVRDSNGTNNLDFNRLNDAVDELNLAYEPVGFHFNICSINYIDNDEYVNGMNQGFDHDSEEYQMAVPNLVGNAINVFFLPKLSYCGWASFPAYKTYYDKDWIVMRSDKGCLNNGSTFAHEMGHYFNLYHTHQGPEPSLDVHEYELVNRTDCGPNIGDELCDTPADPQGLEIGQGERYAKWKCTDATTCALSHDNVNAGCNLTDSKGDLYKPDPANIMGYNRAQCRTYFSPQQIDRMQRSYLYDRDYLTNDCEVSCNNMLTTHDWLENTICSNGSMASITIYKFSEVWNFLDVQTDTERNLYLDNGDFYTGGNSVEDFIIDRGLTEILAVCSLECYVYGCTDEQACNYDPEATFNDGTCSYGYQTCANPCDESSCVYGCMVEEACNYNPEATIEDESCHYGNLACTDPCDNNTCPGQEPACTSIFEDYPWIENEVTGSDDQITVYYFNKSLNFIDIQTDNNRTLYLSSGSGYCFGNQVEVCIESYELEQVLDECTYNQTCNEYGCTDPQAANYSSTADCEDDSCIYICEDVNACNYSAEEICTYGNANCSNPCDESTCEAEPCAPIFQQYGWLEATITCDEDEILVYAHSSGSNFIEVQSPNNSVLYLDNGTFYCSDAQVDLCIESYGLSEPIEQCVCGDTVPTTPTVTCEDATACNFGETAPCVFGNQECPDPCEEDSCVDCEKYTGTIFYADCDGTTYRFVKTDDDHIYDPYFNLVDLEIYDGQRIKFDFIDNDEVNTPCDVAEKAITITCIEEIEIEEEDDSEEEEEEGTDCVDVFTNYPWLLNQVDPENCNGESITVYLYGGIYTFIYINTIDNGDLFYESTLYYSDNGDYTAPAAYDLTEIANWTCGCNFTNQTAKTKVVTTESVKTKGLMNATFKMYPNPANDQLNIELQNANNEAKLQTINIYNVSGQIIQQSSFAGNKTTIDVSDLKKGMYLVEIQNNSNTESNKNSIIQKLLVE